MLVITVVEHEPAGASHCFDVCRERQHVDQCRAKVLCTMGGGDTMELSTGMDRSWEWADLHQEEEQLHLVELVVVGRNPSLDICQAARDVCCHLGVRRGEGNSS